MSGVVSRKAPPRALAAAVVAALPESVVVLDGGGTIVAVNEAWRRLARDNGAPALADGSIGMNYLVVCHGASGPSAEGAGAVYAGLRAVLEGTQPSFALEYPSPSPTGRRWFLLRATPLPGEHGAVVQHIDITARKQVEDERERLRALAEAAQQEAINQARQFEAVFAAIQDGVVVFDRDGRIIRANAADRALLGEGAQAPAGEDVQQRVRRLGMQDADGAPLEAERGPAGRVLRGEVLSSDRAIDVHARAADGRPIEVSVTGAPMFDERGQRAGGVVVYRDVTERRRLERRTAAALDALLAMAELLVAPGPPRREPGTPARADVVARRAAELTRAAFGCERVSIMQLEPEREHLRPIALAGWPPDEERRWRTEGARFALADFLPPTAIARLRSGEVTVDDRTAVPWRRPLDFGAPQVLLVPLRVGTRLLGLMGLDHRRRSHAYTPQELSLAGAIGKLVALVLEREWLERERSTARAQELAALEVSRNLDQFFAIAAHDIRSPLTAALGSAQLAQLRFEPLAALAQAHGGSEADLAARVRSYIQATDDNLERLMRMTGLLFDVAQARTGRLAVRLAPCDLAALVREGVEEQRTAEPERAIRLEISAGAPVPVAADAVRLGQVLANYLTNALKYSPPDRPVEVSLEWRAGQARVAVRDAGPGLPPDEQARVWEPFHRAAGVELQAGAKQGLGLGLHICKTIVERHGGEVGVESAVGAGSTFWFTLPLAEPDAGEWQVDGVETNGPTAGAR